MDKARVKQAQNIAESLQDASNKFVSSITTKEAKRALQTLKDNHSANLVSMVPVLLILQALHLQEVIDDETMAKMLFHMAVGDNEPISATRVLMFIHNERIAGEDYLNGKEI